MSKSSGTVTLADLKRKRSAIERKIADLQAEIDVQKKELSNWDWAEKEFFSEPQHGTVKSMAEDALLDARKPMKPVEIYKAIKELGYQRKKENVYVRLMKWKNQPNPTIVSVRRGFYTHRDLISSMKDAVPSLQVQ